MYKLIVYQRWDDKDGEMFMGYYKSKKAAKLFADTHNLTVIRIEKVS